METNTIYTTEQIRAMLGGITLSNWRMDGFEDEYDLYRVSGMAGNTPETACLVIAKADAQFIAAAPQIIRQLLDEIERRKNERADFPELVEMYTAMKAAPDDIQKRCDYFEALADARLDDCYRCLDQLTDLQRLKGGD